MTKNITCIVCPMGCNLSVNFENGRVKSVTGNNCQRGEKYGSDEFTNPMRTVTTTVRCDSGDMLPVKTDKAIPKEKVLECMEIINSATVRLPVSIGDIIIKDIFGSNIVATANKKG